MVKNDKHVCHGFHIAAQHGNSEVLKRMNRKNTREEFIELTKKLRAAMTSAGAILTDEQALTVSIIYPIWDGNSITYSVGDRVLYNSILLFFLILNIVVRFSK